MDFILEFVRSALAEQPLLSESEFLELCPNHYEPIWIEGEMFVMVVPARELPEWLNLGSKTMKTRVIRTRDEGKTFEISFLPLQGAA